MKISKVFFSLIAAGVVLALAACGAATPSGSSTPVPGSNTAAPAGSSSGACANPWEPVTVGATWTYKVTGITNTNDVRTIETISSNGFTDQSVFSDGTNKTALPEQWKCDNGAQTTLDPFSTAPSGSSTAPALKTDSVDGTGLAANAKPGDSYTVTYHMSGSITENGTTAPMTEVAAYSCKVVDMQSVTVAAGTFDTLHVTCQIGLTITMTIPGAPSTPIQSNSTIERWFVKSVGLVKSVDTSTAGVRTTELTSYMIP